MAQGLTDRIQKAHPVVGTMDGPTLFGLGSCESRVPIENRSITDHSAAADYLTLLRTVVLAALLITPFLSYDSKYQQPSKCITMIAYEELPSTLMVEFEFTY
jgi:hypothetical protein